MEKKRWAESAALNRYIFPSRRRTGRCEMSLDNIERIDRMVMNAEARRNAVLREVSRHRAAFADDLRRSSSAVRDAEFAEVPRR